MTMKQFLDEIEIYTKYFSPEASEFYYDLKNKLSKTFTENGAKILKCMQINREQYLNTFSSKQLGELLFMPPRSVSGSIRKLITNGYVEKHAGNPITYGLTDEGKDLQLD